jgi:uncharacterized membrane protein
MTRFQTAQLYVVMLFTGVALDVVWLGFVEHAFYTRQLSHLMAENARVWPAALFYLVYTAALISFVVWPARRRNSAKHAIRRGAFFGVTAYSAFDLTGLALLKDFPVSLAVVDLAWGAILSAVVSVAGYSFAQRWQATVRSR